MRKTQDKKILMVAPSFDEASKVSFSWYKDALKKLRKSGWEITTLEKNQVTRYNFEREIRGNDIFAYWNHGDYDKLADKDKNNLVDTENAFLLKGKEVWAMACRSARDLGDAAVKDGAKLYQGFRKVFILTYPPFSFFFKRPANKGILSRPDHAIEECEQMQKAEFLKNIMEVLLIPGYGLLYAVFLAWDMSVLTYKTPEGEKEGEKENGG
jgi:hypothetical protein